MVTGPKPNYFRYSDDLIYETRHSTLPPPPHQKKRCEYLKDEINKLDTNSKKKKNIKNMYRHK